jgi:hypothetical protein
LEKDYDTETEIVKPNGAPTIISTTNVALRIALVEIGVLGVTAP